MKKISSALFLAGAVTLGLASCNKNQTPEDTPDLSGTTHGVVTAQLVRSGNSLKADPSKITDGQQDVAGQGGEDKVKDGYLFFKEATNPSVNLNMIQDANTASTYVSQAFKTTPNASAHATLILNKGIDLVEADFSKTKTISLEDLDKFIKDDGFMMTSSVEDQTANKLEIKANKKEKEVLDGTANNFTFKVERVVAKLQVSKASLVKFDAKLKEKGDVKVDDLTYSMAGSAKTSYLFTDNAGKRTLTDDENKDHVYEGFKSFIDDKTDNLDQYIQKISDKKSGASGYAYPYFVTPKKVSNDSKKKSIADGFYFFENSRYGNGNLPTEKGQILYERIVYAKVYTYFMVKKGRKLSVAKYEKLSYDPSMLVEAKESDFTKPRTYNVAVPESWYNDHKADATLSGKLKEVPEVNAGGVKTPKHWTLEVTDEANTFYVGADGQIYDTQLAAAAAGNKTYKKYVGGKMVYMTPANTQKKDGSDLINYCDTRRNNIYDLKITDFVDLGFNYDPVDPEDPNIPQPKDNPNEPQPDPKKPVQEAKTYMRVKATILLWNLVDREVKLGEEL